jgi:glycosyltransferase involved in cell wall biosynthesis
MFMRIAYIGSPGIGGGYTQYCLLKKKLVQYDFILVQLGKHSQSEHFQSHTFVSLGVGLDPSIDAKKLAKLFIEYIIENNIDIVVPNNSPMVISCLPYLPENVQIVYRVNSDTPRVYQYVATHSDYISRIVCISPIQLKKLGNRYPELRDKLVLIPHGLDVQEIDSVSINEKKAIQIGFLGRLQDGHKKVLIIPEILRRFNGNYNLHIIGDGPDRIELLNLLDKHNISYTYHGFVKNEDLEPIISLWDIMLFPSIVEGFGLTLIETMQYGVVPIANRLEGITDYIIENGESGYLISKNDISSYLNKLNKLNNDSDLLLKMKKKAKSRVIDKFNLSKVCNDYDMVFRDAMLYHKPPTNKIADWKPYKEYKPSILQRAINRMKLYFRN